MSRACLTDSKVNRELVDGDVDTNTSMMEVQDANDLAVYTWTGAGYCGDILKAKIKETTTKEPITERNSQARIEILAKAITHGTKFTATGGFYINSDYMFKSLEISIREKEISDMEKDKRTRVEKEKFETDDPTALASRPPCFPVNDLRQWKVPMMDGILWWYGMSKV